MFVPNRGRREHRPFPVLPARDRRGNPMRARSGKTAVMSGWVTHPTGVEPINQGKGHGCGQ